MIVLKVIGIILAVLLGIVFLLILLLAAADWTLRFRLESDTWSIQIGAFPILARVFPMKKKTKKEKPPSPKTEKRKKAVGKVKKQAEEALPRQVESLVSELTDRAKGLTGTERVILRYYAEGYTVKDISGLLFISAGTVKGPNSHIYSKLGVGIPTPP